MTSVILYRIVFVRILDAETECIPLVESNGEISVAAGEYENGLSVCWSISATLGQVSVAKVAEHIATIINLPHTFSSFEHFPIG